MFAASDIERNESAVETGIFQLLSQPEGVTDAQVIEQALWEVDFAEANGFDTVWVTEHHLSNYGLIGSPSVYAAAIAQRTKRIRVGYAAAIAPLHHPIRLAEEISLVDHLSGGRVWVGLGPGFNQFEFEAFGVDIDDRRDRLDEAIDILEGLFGNETYGHDGRFWKFPPVTLKPRPLTVPHPPFMITTSTLPSLERAAKRGLPVLIGFSGDEAIAERLEQYRNVRAGCGATPEEIDTDVSRIGVLRRIHVADTDEEAMENVLPALLWYKLLQHSFYTKLPNLPDGTTFTKEELLKRAQEA